MILMKNIMNINTIKNNYDNFPNENTPNKNYITKDTEIIIQTLDTIINVVYWNQKYKELIKNIVYIYLNFDYQKQQKTKWIINYSI